MVNQHMDQLRKQIDAIDEQLLNLFNQRASVVEEIGKTKVKQGTLRYDPVRERQVLDRIAAINKGPFSTETLQHLFKEIFKVSLRLQEDDHSEVLLVSRKQHPENTVVDIRGQKIGDGKKYFVAGPCSVESEEQVRAAAAEIKKNGLTLLRGGAFKPRTSPYDFQGLGEEGLKILRKVADEFGLSVISEIMAPEDVEMSLKYVDVIQVGARNMQNFNLLKAVGKVKKPVLLKRGLSATIQEFKYAAEYILSQGNDQVILCERGIRTYERATRNTLDITAVPILKQETHLPVAVDVTHSTGRRDIMIPAAKAALAIGADMIMAEVHPDPAVALSDSQQQMDFEQFDAFMDALKPVVFS